MRYTFTILEEHRQQLRRLLFRDDCEYGALLLCGRSRHVDPWTRGLEERALVREVVVVPEEAFFQRTPTSMTWSTTPLFDLAKRAISTDSAICIAHSHPNGELVFSPFDDVADKESFEIVFARMETDRPHFSLVMNEGGEFQVRAYGPDLKPQEPGLTRVIGDRLSVRYPNRGNGQLPEEFDRQARVFGARSTEDLAHLRVGIVGCGGTGSAVASLLARIGVSRLVLVDSDQVDLTSLNRMHFSKRSDAIAGHFKVDVVREAVAEIGLASSVVAIRGFVDDVECRDALRACDVIFGCTDDHLGRNYLNHLAYFYLIPVIDLGVLIDPNNEGSYDSFDGRVTVVQPGYPCQRCRQLISSQRMLEEGMRRHRPSALRAIPTCWVRRRRGGSKPCSGDVYDRDSSSRSR